MTVQQLIPLTVLFLPPAFLVVAVCLTRRPQHMLARVSLRPGAAPGQDPAEVAKRARAALPRPAKPIVPENDAQRTHLQLRLLQAGLYAPQAMAYFLGVKSLLMLGPWALGLTAGLAGLVPVPYGVVFGGFAGLVGMLAPGAWLNKRKLNRQARLRGSLPDVMDLLVICLESGLSLPEAFRRVVPVLRPAHPLLGMELGIVQREMQMGSPSGAALRRFAERSGLQEVRNLASIVTQVERYGGGLVKPLRVQAEALRFARMQLLEETAQKSGTKVLLPTLLCIFPGIFTIILGPAALQVADLLTKLTPAAAQAKSTPAPGKLP